MYTQYENHCVLCVPLVLARWCFSVHTIYSQRLLSLCVTNFTVAAGYTESLYCIFKALTQCRVQRCLQAEI